MLKIEFTGQFRRDYKLALKRGFNERDLTTVVLFLPLGNRFPRNTETMHWKTHGTTKMCANVISNPIGC